MECNFTNAELTAIQTAREGDSDILFDMAVKYATDENRLDFRKSLAMFEICKECGSLSAYKNLVRFYANGWGTERNLEKALEYQGVCVLTDYTLLPQYVIIAKELYGSDGAYEYLKAIIDLLEENQCYSETEESAFRLFADFLYGLGMETTEKKGSCINDSLVWYEKSANLGNLNSMQLAMFARSMNAETYKLMGCHDEVVEEHKWVVYWAKAILNAEQANHEDKQKANEKIQEATLETAMALCITKDYSKALQFVRVPELKGIPMAQLVEGWARWSLLKDEGEAAEVVQHLKVINNFDNWKDTNWDFYNRFFVSFGGLALSTLYRTGAASQTADLEAAYMTLQNVLVLIKDDEDIRKTVTAELQKYKRNWLGKLQYTG